MYISKHIGCPVSFTDQNFRWTGMKLSLDAASGSPFLSPSFSLSLPPSLITKLSTHYVLTKSTISGPGHSDGTRPSPKLSLWVYHKIWGKRLLGSHLSHHPFPFYLSLSLFLTLLSPPHPNFLLDGLVVCHLPYGPTASFSLFNTVMRHDIPKWGHCLRPSSTSFSTTSRPSWERGLVSHTYLIVTGNDKTAIPRN